MTLSSLVFAVALVGCVPPVVATTPSPPAEAEAVLTIAAPLDVAQQRLVEKLSERGFALVERRATQNSAWLRFSGNRDYTVTTIGSVFAASLRPLTASSTQIELRGKPTIDHYEECPSFGDEPCDPATPRVRYAGATHDFALTGREEADVIRGVFAELQLDGTIHDEL